MPTSFLSISASLMAADFLNLKEDIDLIVEAGINRLHIDIMDGHFVPNLTFGPDLVKKVCSYTGIPVDIHLMVESASEFINMFAHTGTQTIIIHPESDYHPYRCLEYIRSLNIRSGVALNPGTSIESVIPLLPVIDHLLVMTVNPGFGGQSFLSSQLEKISLLRKLIDKHNLPITLEVDGGVNQETAESILNAGANSLVSGSYLFNKDKLPLVDNYQQRINQLRIKR